MSNHFSFFNSLIPSRHAARDQNRNHDSSREAERKHKHEHFGDPYLPSPRPRALTLTPTSPVDTHEQAHVATQKSRFFALPREIRDEVYMHLFGNRNVHIAYRRSQGILVFKTKSPPDEEKVSRWGSTWGLNWGGKQAKDDDEQEDGKKDKDQTWDELERTETPEIWEMMHCICRRHGEGGGWWEDYRGCVNGNSSVQHVGGQGTTCDDGNCECFLGVMGWLLSCRQAYSESIPILYTTTTFNLSNKTPSLFQDHLPHLLPPHHMARITSLDLTWRLIPMSQWGLPAYRALEPILLQYFPRLRSLRIAILYPADCSFNPLIADLRRVPRAVVRKLGGNLRHCELVVPGESVYRMLKKSAVTRRDGAGDKLGATGHLHDSDESHDGSGELERQNGLVGSAYTACFWERVELEDGTESGFWFAQSKV